MSVTQDQKLKKKKLRNSKTSRTQELRKIKSRFAGEML